jgi:hypothetical protein
MNPSDDQYRISTRVLWLAVIIGLMAILVACGGSGVGVNIAGVGSGGTGAAISGPISGFGSIIVNGVRIDDSSASITVDGRTGGTETDLKLGMMVDVEAVIDVSGVTGKASRISGRSLLQGPVSDISAGANRLTVLGMTVTVTPRTVFDGPGVTGLDALRADDSVEVHGIPDTSGGLKATRIERLSANHEIHLTGKVQEGAGSSSFSVNGYTVQYQPGDLVSMPNGVTPGSVVSVKGTLSGTTVDASTVSAISLAPAVKDRQRVEMEGVVTAFTSATRFELNGMPVTVPGSARVEGTVSLGDRVEVEGQVDGQTLVASKVEVDDDKTENDEEAFEMNGNIVGVNAAAGTFTMRKGDVTVKWDSNTKFDKGSSSTLAPGAKVKVKGKMKGNILLATKVERDD